MTNDRDFIEALNKIYDDLYIIDKIIDKLDEYINNEINDFYNQIETISDAYWYIKNKIYSIKKLNNNDNIKKLYNSIVTSYSKSVELKKYIYKIKNNKLYNNECILLYNEELKLI